MLATEVAAGEGVSVEVRVGVAVVSACSSGVAVSVAVGVVTTGWLVLGGFVGVLVAVAVGVFVGEGYAALIAVWFAARAAAVAVWFAACAIAVAVHWAGVYREGLQVFCATVTTEVPSAHKKLSISRKPITILIGQKNVVR